MKTKLAMLVFLPTALMTLAVPAHSEIVLSQLVLDVAAQRPGRQDVEISNTGKERAYVSVTPAEIVGAGTDGEKRVEERDPEKLGILVSPARLILEPGQHKIIRVTPLGNAPARERVYRMTVRPEVGDIADDQSGLKILIGYDVLVILRPAGASPKLTGRWSGSQLEILNEGNSSVELTGGRQCISPDQCKDLPPKRLYAGASWVVPVTGHYPVEYRYPQNGRSQTVRF